MMAKSKREWNRKQLAGGIHHSVLVNKAQPACALLNSTKIFKLSLSLWWTKAHINFHFHIARILLKTPSHIFNSIFFLNLIWENTHKNPSLTKYFTEQSTCQIKVVFKLKFKTSAEIKHTRPINFRSLRQDGAQPKHGLTSHYQTRSIF